MRVSIIGTSRGARKAVHVDVSLGDEAKSEVGEKGEGERESEGKLDS